MRGGDYFKAHRARLKPPVLVVLGSPRETFSLVENLGQADIHCYQMDLFSADRIRDNLAEWGLAGKVVASADIWDLPAIFSTAIYPVPRAGERSLKIDVVEQTFHVLQPGGTFFALSPYQHDQFFPGLLKKVFGKVHATPEDHGTVLWGIRGGDHPRRRHQVSFHVREPNESALEFLSRPGVFSYGKFDTGARALIESMTIRPGESILDLGCGSGTNGVCAGRRAGENGSVVFVDSNLRAVDLAAINAQANGITRFTTSAAWKPDALPRSSADVVLANPPYFGHGEIAQRFVEHARHVLRPKGRMYLVTKQADTVGELLLESFRDTSAIEARGYTVFEACGVR